jgi:hypothetical protein
VGQDAKATVRALMDLGWPYTCAVDMVLTSMGSSPVSEGVQLFIMSLVAGREPPVWLQAASRPVGCLSTMLGWPQGAGDTEIKSYLSRMFAPWQQRAAEKEALVQMVLDSNPGLTASSQPCPAAVAATAAWLLDPELNSAYKSQMLITTEKYQFVQKCALLPHLLK